MTNRLLSDLPWTRTTELATYARAWVAVPFIGQGAVAMLPLTAGRLLVTWLVEATMRQDEVHSLARETLMLIRRPAEPIEQ